MGKRTSRHVARMQMRLAAALSSSAAAWPQRALAARNLAVAPLAANRLRKAPWKPVSGAALPAQPGLVKAVVAQSSNTAAASSAAGIYSTLSAAFVSLHPASCAPRQLAWSLPLQSDANSDDDLEACYACASVNMRVCRLGKST